MTRPAWSDADKLTNALRHCAGKVYRTAPAAWHFTLRNGKPMAVRAAFNGEWLRLMTAATLEPAPDLPWRLLGLNGKLASGAKVTFDQRARSTSLCVDACLASEDSSAHRLGTACSSLLEAGASLASLGEDAPIPLGLPLDERLDDGVAAQCRSLLNDAQWPWTERADERIRVDLETRRGHAQVLIAQCGDAVRLGMELVDATELSGTCRVALGAFLLAASGALRLVRAAAALNGERETAGLEVVLTSPLSASDLDTALGGLASAYDQLGPEALALRHDRLASEYLAVSGCARALMARAKEPIPQGG